MRFHTQHFYHSYMPLHVTVHFQDIILLQYILNLNIHPVSAKDLLVSEQNTQNQQYFPDYATNHSILDQNTQNERFNPALVKNHTDFDLNLQHQLHLAKAMNHMKNHSTHPARHL